MTPSNIAARLPRSRQFVELTKLPKVHPAADPGDADNLMVFQ